MLWAAVISLRAKRLVIGLFLIAPRLVFGVQADQFSVLFDQSIELVQHDQWDDPSPSKLPIHIVAGSTVPLRGPVDSVIRITIETPGFQQYIPGQSTFIRDMQLQVLYTDDSVSITSPPAQWGYTVMNSRNRGRHVLEERSVRWGQIEAPGSLGLYEAAALPVSSAEIIQPIKTISLSFLERLRLQDKYDFLTIPAYETYQTADALSDIRFTQRIYDIPVSLSTGDRWELTVLIRNLALAPIDEPERRHVLSSSQQDRAVVIRFRPAQSEIIPPPLTPLVPDSPSELLSGSARHEAVIVNSIGMTLMWIAPGEFDMGSDSADSDAAPSHRVRISRGFYLGQTEVTRSQYVAVMGDQPWSGKKYILRSVNCPAVYVSWTDAEQFCKKLSQMEKKMYRLPTEAEWEYACRAGTQTAFSFGNDENQLDRYAWFSGNAWAVDQRYAHRVSRRMPNPWGFYDMHGNVWEWCSDWYDSHYYTQSPSIDPKGPDRGVYRILRGGAWGAEPDYCHSAYRNGSTPISQFSNIGFRVVMDAP